jgi:hypothetical protein
MQCSQAKPFTMSSTNPKIGGAAIKSYEKGGMVTKPPSGEADMKYTGMAQTKDGRTVDTYRDKAGQEWDYSQKARPSAKAKRT